MRQRTIVSSALAGCLVLAGTGWALGQQVAPRRAQETRTTTSTEVRRVSTVIGASVRVEGGETFGKVEDVVLSEDGCIDYVVLGYEDRFIAVPWTIVRADFAQRTVLVNVDRRVLLDAPHFARGEWAELSANSAFVQKVRTHFRSHAGQRTRETGVDTERRGTERRDTERRGTDAAPDRRGTERRNDRDVPRQAAPPTPRPTDRDVAPPQRQPNDRPAPDRTRDQDDRRNLQRDRTPQPQPLPSDRPGQRRPDDKQKERDR
jgi:hypothetical protein